MGLLKDTMHELDKPAILLGNGINQWGGTFIDWSQRGVKSNYFVQDLNLIPTINTSLHIIN